MRGQRNQRARPFQPRNRTQNASSPATLPPRPDVAPQNGSDNTSVPYPSDSNAQAYYNYAAQAYYYQWAQYYAQLGYQPYYGPPPTSGYPSQPSHFGQQNMGYHTSQQTYPNPQNGSMPDQSPSSIHPATRPVPNAANGKGKGTNKSDETSTIPANAQGGKRRKDPKIMLPAPDPSPEYLAIAAQEPSVVHSTNHLLVILDLNGTLIYRPNRNAKSMVARPFVEPFLRYLFKNFSVMVWSSARPENVKVLVENVLGKDLRSKLAGQWARDTLGLSPQQYNQNVQVYKRLETVWCKEEIQRHNPDYDNGKRFGQHNTILIDDSALKANAQPHNLLHIPEFKGSSEDMNSDVLREVAGYLEVLRTQEDVSKLIRKEPFQANGRWTYNWADGSAPGGQLKQKISLQERK